MEFYKEHPEEKSKLLYIVGNVSDTKERVRMLEQLSVEMQNKFDSFVQARSDNPFNYIKMFERSQEFVFASRTQNWELHLQSCAKLAVDFHATNRIKYMRMMPYYITSQYALMLCSCLTHKHGKLCQKVNFLL